MPRSIGDHSTVVRELDRVLSGVVEGDVSVRLREDVDEGGQLGILSREVLVVVERIALHSGLGDAVERRDLLKLRTVASNLELEDGVDSSIVVRLRAVDGRLHLEPDVEDLPTHSQPRIHAREGKVRTCPAMNSVSVGGKRHPKLPAPHAAVRRNVCAETVVAAASARATQILTMSIAVGECRGESEGTSGTDDADNTQEPRANERVYRSQRASIPPLGSGILATKNLTNNVR